MRTLMLLVIVIASIQLSAQELRNNNCRMIMTGGVQLVIKDMKFTNNGIVTTGKSTVWFTGKQSTSIAGNNPVAFYDLTINKSFGKTLELQQNFSVGGTLTMNSGNVLLNNRQLNLGTTGTIAGENSQSYITGTSGGSVLANRKMATAPTAVNPGNIGIEITCNVPLGNVLVERKHVQEILPGGDVSIQRSFNINSDAKGNKAIALRLYYLDEELNGADETNLNIWTGSDISNSWILAGNNGNDPVSNWVFQKGFDRPGRFTLASSGFAFKKSTNRKIVQQQSLNESINRITVYPNPSFDKCTLEFSGSEAKQTTLKLYDQWGRMLQQKNIHCSIGINKVTWEIGQYAAGMYLIKDDTGSVNVKIIKQ